MGLNFEMFQRSLWAHNFDFNYIWFLIIFSCYAYVLFNLTTSTVCFITSFIFQTQT